MECNLKTRNSAIISCTMYVNKPIYLSIYLSIYLAANLSISKKVKRPKDKVNQFFALHLKSRLNRPPETQEITTTQVSREEWTILLYFSTFWGQFKISHTFLYMTFPIAWATCVGKYKIQESQTWKWIVQFIWKELKTKKVLELWSVFIIFMGNIPEIVLTIENIQNVSCKVNMY